MALKLVFPLLLTGCFWVTTKSEGESLRRVPDEPT